MNMCPFLHIRPSRAESKTFATQHAALTPVSCSVVPQNPIYKAQFSALRGWATVSGGFVRHNERSSCPLGEPCHLHMVDSVPDFISY